jgi:hypothetical protein
MTPEQAAKVAAKIVAIAARCEALAEDMYAAIAELGGCSCQQRGECTVCVLDCAAGRVDEARHDIEGL